MDSEIERARKRSNETAEGEVGEPVESQVPEYIRLPKPGQRCPYSNLSRTVLWQLVSSGKVKSVQLRQPGASRGVRLIRYASLVSYLRQLEAEQDG